MPFVIYAAPWFSETSLRYIEALVSLDGVQVGVISHDPFERLPPEMQGRIAGHWGVNDMLDSAQLTHAAQSLAQRFGPIAALLSHQEQFQVPLAEVRERLGIPGMGVEVAQNFRDKVRMKARFHAAGVPCARFRLVQREADGWSFAEEVGYPLVVKPVAGAAAQATFRVDDAAGLGEAMATLALSEAQPVLIEEFVVGEEHSFETFALGGQPLWHSLTHYNPSPLTVLGTPWIQWSVVLPREVDSPRYDDIRAAAFQALKVLGMETGLSHMEWFRRRDGSVAISEVAARPPGAQFPMLMSVAHDFDCFQAWARLMVFGEFQPPARRYAAGAAYLRGQSQGYIKAVHGLEQADAELGSLVVAAKIPQVGQPTSTSYEGDGYIIIRHPETEVVREALLRLINIIQVEVG